MDLDCDSNKFASKTDCRLSTSAWIFGESNANYYTIGTKSRRLDLHQHLPVYETGASLFGHVGNQARAQGFEPCATVLESVCPPREHARVVLIKWTQRESNSDLRRAIALSSRWTVSPCCQWTAEELNPDCLVAGQVSCRWTSSPIF